MRRYLFLLIFLLVIFGCGKAPQEKNIVAKINDYEITKEEFGEEFKASSYGHADTPDSRKDFLNTLINRKLILQDAQKKGLDKDKSFLKMIERFWEQSLLKLAFDKKNRETAGSIPVNDKEIEDIYNNMLKEGKTDKSYDQMYQQIKWELTRERESQLMDDWINQLHKKANIKINEELFNKLSAH